MAAYSRNLQVLLELAGPEANGVTGDGPAVELQLRFPDKSKMNARFSEGATMAAVAACAMQSPWGTRTRPASVKLSTAHPPETLQLSGALGKDMDRQIINVEGKVGDFMGLAVSPSAASGGNQLTTPLLSAPQVLAAADAPSSTRMGSGIGESIWGNSSRRSGSELQTGRRDLEDDDCCLRLAALFEDGPTRPDSRRAASFTGWTSSDFDPGQCGPVAQGCLTGALMGVLSSCVIAICIGFHV
mmetsp:Transcript_44461/g.81173  ORF Transcript_44461/g.81173 Transcript_44461/m.81173 type:complete len:243 (+) Transcript_44461:46-774(+)